MSYAAADLFISENQFGFSLHPGKRTLFLFSLAGHVVEIILFAKSSDITI